MVTSHSCASEELYLVFDSPRSGIRSGYIESKEQLLELWEIDKKAYGDNSIPFDPFYQWWTNYRYGSSNLFLKGQIIASIGIYPLSEDQAIAFKSGQIKEESLVPLTLDQCNQGASHWYWSGLVIVPEWQNRGLVKSLLRIGLGCWRSKGHIRYPLSLLALGQIEIDKKLLAQKLGFKKLKSGSEMPDGLDLFELSADSDSDFAALLNSRGL